VGTFGKYRLVEPLASGGMADVWRAEVQLAAGVVKEVALKLVRGAQAERGDFVRMFVEEARLACRLGHANVVQVFEFDQVDGQYYLAMELVQGRHLGQVVERARELGLRLGLPRAVHVAAEAAKALAYVHRVSDGGRPLGLVHRDVSPHNLLVSFEGEVKLADFGIARAMSLAGLTEPGTLKGKTAYMAPEQAGGGPVDGRADVYSLGVVLWELCTGRRLFARETEAATLAAVLGGPPPSPPSAWNEAVPPELDAVVLGALEREPARRTASADELGAALLALLLRLAASPQDWDLRPFMQRLWPDGTEPRPAPLAEPTAVRAPAGEGAGPGAAPVPAPAAPGEGTAATRTLPPLRRRRARWPAAALALLVAAGAGLAALRRPGSLPPASLPDRAAAPAPAPAPEQQPEPAAAASSPPSAEPAAPPAGAAAAPAQGGVEDGSSAGPAGPGGEAASTEDGTQRPGSLYVNATPWARIAVNGKPVGETPLTLMLPPGRHRVRATHPSYGAREIVLEIRPGRRSSWVPNLQR
jgi:tRNA A-37 threonylcarbamoyl transferase component Bud32